MAAYIKLAEAINKPTLAGGNPVTDPALTTDAPWYIQWLVRERSMIRKAPVTFFMTVALVAVGIFFVFQFAYGARLGLLETHVNELTFALSNAKDQIDSAYRESASARIKSEELQRQVEKLQTVPVKSKYMME